jgi:hypothetical protein
MTPECHLLRRRESCWPSPRTMLDRFGELPALRRLRRCADRLVHVGFGPASAHATDRAQRALAQRSGGDRRLRRWRTRLCARHPPAVPRDGMDSAIRLHLSHVGGGCMDLIIPYRARKATPTL